MAYNEVVDALDQMIDAGKPDFLDEKNRKKLEDMRKHAKSLLYIDASWMDVYEASTV